MRARRVTGAPAHFAHLAEADRAIIPHPMPAPTPMLVLYDGGCGFCRASAAFAAGRLRRTDTRFAALASDEGRAALRAYGFPADYDRSVVVIDAGSAYTESTAAWRLANRLRWPWRLLALGRLVPRPPRDAAYRWIARHRGRLPGGGVCTLPAPK